MFNRDSEIAIKALEKIIERQERQIEALFNALRTKEKMELHKPKSPEEKLTVDDEAETQRFIPLYDNPMAGSVVNSDN